MVAERSEEAALSGFLQVSMDGSPVELPVLKLKHSRAWKVLLGESVKGVELDDDLVVTLGRVANLASEVALDLLLAYDRENVLGGRDRVEETATDAELFAALEQLVKVTFPFEGHIRSVVEAFGPQLRALGHQMMTSVAERLSQASSTSTPSANGASTPTPLRSVSPTSSSLSSGRTTRKASSGRPKSAG